MDEIFEKQVTLKGKKLKITIIMPVSFTSGSGYDLDSYYFGRIVCMSVPEFSQFKNNISLFYKEKICPYLESILLKVINENIQSLPDELIIRIYLSEGLNSFLNHHDKGRCHITLSEKEVVSDFCMKTLPAGLNQTIRDEMMNKLRLNRLSFGGWTDVYDTFRHEFLHYLNQEKSGNYYLLTEAISILDESRTKSFICYPKSAKFGYVKGTEQPSRLPPKKGYLHDHSYFMAFFIGLAYMKTKLPEEFVKMRVMNCRKEWTNLRWVDFNQLLIDENRPLYFMNLPLNVINLIFQELSHSSNQRFASQYFKAANALGIKKEHWLVRKKFWLGLGKDPYIFSS